VKTGWGSWIRNGIGERMDAITLAEDSQFVTSNGSVGETQRHHELGASSLPNSNTFPRVTKFANPIRASISSIVLDAQIEGRGKAETVS